MARATRIPDYLAGLDAMTDERTHHARPITQPLLVLQSGGLENWGDTGHAIQLERSAELNARLELFAASFAADD